MASVTVSKSTTKAKPAVTASFTFSYKGTDRKGNTVQGEISGSSPAIVKAQLAKQGINAKSIIWFE